MNASLFIQWVEKWFKPIAGLITETINGKKEEAPYLHDQMLQREYSADLRWDSSSIDGSIVAADVVAMDSELPVKSRDSLGRASGDIPKIGMKLFKGEKLISDIQVMAARGAGEKQIVAKLFEDSPRCAKAVKERNEGMFLQGIQTGILLVEDDENVGTAIRANYGYLPDNKFGVAVKWDAPGFTPLSDIARVISKASDDGNLIRTIGVSLNDFNSMRRSDEAKELTANFDRRLVGVDSKLPIPTKSLFMEAFKEEYGATLLIIDRSIKTEKNGKRTSRKAFADGTLVLLTTEPTEKVGRLVFGTLAEETSPVAGVQYEKVDGYILLSKYSKNDPLREYTSSQALCIPVIDNVDCIYTLNTQDAQEVATTEVEGDANITVYDKKIAKAEVLNALKSLGFKVSPNIGDATLIKKINELNEEQEAALKELVEAMEIIA